LLLDLRRSCSSNSFPLLDSFNKDFQLFSGPAIGLDFVRLLFFIALEDRDQVFGSLSPGEKIREENPEAKLFNYGETAQVFLSGGPLIPPNDFSYQSFALRRVVPFF